MGWEMEKEEEMGEVVWRGGWGSEWSNEGNTGKGEWKREVRGREREASVGEVRASLSVSIEMGTGSGGGGESSNREGVECG